MASDAFQSYQNVCRSCIPPYSYLHMF